MQISIKLLKRLCKLRRHIEDKRIQNLTWQMFITRLQFYDAMDKHHYQLVRSPLDCSYVYSEAWQGLKISGVILNEHVLN